MYNEVEQIKDSDHSINGKNSHIELKAYELNNKTHENKNPSINNCLSLFQLIPIIYKNQTKDVIVTCIYDYDDLLDEFLQKVNPEIKICYDDPKGPFIACEYNRDGDCHRSPHSNQYFPTIVDSQIYPPYFLRNLEIKLNIIFQFYLKHYYTKIAISSLCSVYCWDLGNSISDGFAFAVLMIHQNKIKKVKRESCHYLQVEFKKESSIKIKANYHLISTTNLNIMLENKICGNIILSGTTVKHSLYSEYISDTNDEKAHIRNIGILVEDMERDLENADDIYYCRGPKEIINSMRNNTNNI